MWKEKSEDKLHSLKWELFYFAKRNINHYNWLALHQKNYHDEYC
jgi:hypothetical protein